ncbi:unnamed protein product [Paramecium pentaurelia]|uniref:Aurora kinase n=1 Tax=Paramecium pentaurelia TaxID=43138 RepID=A0A8S1WMY1_9CILI|nr:unnamed protein product [Paramecium pentaurelia]
MHKLPSSRSASTNPIKLINKLNSPLHTQQDIIDPKINRKELIDTLLKTIKKKSNQNEKPKKRIRSNANSGQKLVEINQNVLHIQDYNTEQFQFKKVISKIILPKTQQLSNYNMLQFIGKGKYSEVQLACEITTGIHVALKIMKKQQIQSIWKSIAQELKIQYLLNHPNIVKLYTFFQTTLDIILVLEYCCHGQLHKVLRSLPETSFTEQVAASYIKQIALALNYLHRNGIIHRDLKPENIFLCYDQVKLADFTHSIYSPQQERSTQCGSLAYISPEIIKGENYDKSTDMWSLGVLAYELCSGETPWEDLSYLEMQQIILSGNIRFPSKFTPELKDFIKNLIHIDPKNRMNTKQVLNHPWLQETKQEVSQFTIDI